MRKALLGLLVAVLTGGCGAGYVMSEMTGSAKPEGGIKEVIPESKEYRTENGKLWKACCDVLEEQGYMISADSASGRIKSDPKMISDPSKLQIVGAEYYAVVSVKVDGSAVTYRAKFNKKSNLVQDTDLREYPEKENELRRDFFLALDKKLGG